MTEQEWLTGSDLREMVLYVRDRVGHRKLRLFACACCRLVWDTLPSDCCRWGVDVGERFADRLASSQERQEALEAIQIMKEQAVAGYDFEKAAALRDTQSPVEADIK